VTAQGSGGVGISRTVAGTTFGFRAADTAGAAGENDGLPVASYGVAVEAAYSKRRAE